MENARIRILFATVLDSADRRDKAVLLKFQDIHNRTDFTPAGWCAR